MEELHSRSAAVVVMMKKSQCCCLGSVITIAVVATAAVAAPGKARVFGSEGHQQTEALQNQNVLQFVDSCD